MRKLLFIRFYCDLALVVAVGLVFYPLDYLYSYTLDPVFYIEVGAAVTGGYLLLGGLMAFTCLLIQKGQVKLPSYRAQVVLFIVESCLLAGVLIASITLDNEPLIENVALPFMIVFVVLSVFLLRTVRDLGNIAAEKRNMRIAAVVLVLLVLLNNATRQVIARLAVHIPQDINYVVTKIVSIPGSDAPPKEHHEKEKPILVIKKPDILKIILITLAVILVLLLLILFIRLVVKNYRNLKKREPYAKDLSFYDEKREFIKATDSYDAKREKPQSHDYRTTVRACYAKFMRFCKEKSVEVKASDTTGQINEKYGAKYPAEAADALRSIYVRVRYSNETASKELAEQSMAEYRQIRQGASQVKGQRI